MKFAKFESPEDMSVVDALSNKKILERTGLKYLDSQVSSFPVDFRIKNDILVEYWWIDIPNETIPINIKTSSPNATDSSQNCIKM